MAALAAALLPLILRTDDAKVSQVEYNKHSLKRRTSPKLADDELNNYIETLIKARDETRAIIDVLEGNKTANDNLTDSVREQTDALRYLTDNQKAVLASKLELKMAEEEGRDSHLYD